MRSLLTRRALVLGGATVFACSRSERLAGGRPALPASTNLRVLEWDLGPQPWGPGRAVILVPVSPTESVPGRRYPVVLALHGRGEALKSPADGAMGWPRDYALVRAFDRLRAPPLRETDFEGLVEPARLAETNVSLASNPFGGVIVACPWLPDVRPAATADIGAIEHFVLDVLLPKVRAETPALASPEATGIDGVSLGGVLALRIGLTRPDAFGAVGGIQPAVDERQNAEWTSLAQAARALRPELRLRLLTSHDDYFHDPVTSLSHAWGSAGVAHAFGDVVGPHDYIFNRGPGSIELLLWNDRALARA